MDKRVGFIGLGIMGLPMARNLVKSGFEVVVYNRTASRAASLVREGACQVGSPREVAEAAPVVITIVSDTPDVEEVILGASGVIGGARPGSVVIDMSTISPRATRQIAARLAEKRVDMLDAPVSGGDIGAINATLTIMVGGKPETFERCRPIFEAMGKTVTHVGSTGMGQTVKLMNQILLAGCLMGVVESLIFGQRSGVDLDKAINAVKGGAAGSWILSNLGPKIVKRDFRPGFTTDLFQKDLKLVMEAAEEMKLPLPVASLIHQLYYSLQCAGEGRSAYSALIKVLEGIAGVEVGELEQVDARR